MKRSAEICDWEFSIPALEYSKNVRLPHTWNVVDETMNYRGEGIYTAKVFLSEAQRDKKVFLCFGAAYHSADIYVNGVFAGCHHSGYTPFEIEITPFIHFGEENQIKVTVNNTPSDQILPYNREFDWADDGGLIRKVTLCFHDTDDISELDVSYDLYGFSDTHCDGQIFVSAAFYDKQSREAQITLTDPKTDNVILEEKQVLGTESAVLRFKELELWQPENPKLYRLIVRTKTDTVIRKIGLRSMDINKGTVLLNGKRIFLKGCEWMPGSHPDYGMAEPLSHSVKCLSQLKKSGCVFTRFHWQQDDAILDWCDENGLMVQEEISYWGSPKVATDLQVNIAKQQADEMVKHHKHHPSVICWGIGNELDGTSEDTIAYVDELYSYVKALDPGRFVNYVSDTLGKPENECKDDATLHGDIAMWNDYLGLWQPCEDIEWRIWKTAKRCWDKPLIISEFGLCEPAFEGGDKRRSEILEQRVSIYKQISNISGYVWFSLNDYRTQYGEYGEGKFRRRIHGSTDLYGNKKPSYQILCRL